MPKDATKNVDRYKVRGGQLNEFDFQQNQEAFAEQQRTQPANLIPGTPPETRNATTESSTTKQAAKATKAATATKAGKAKKAAKATTAVKATKASKAAKATKATKATTAKKATKARKATKATKSRKSTKKTPVGATAKKLAARKAAQKK